MDVSKMFEYAHVWISGLLLGMEDVKWNSNVSLVTMETEGSTCFNESLKCGKIVTLEGINSIAKSFGALRSESS